MSEKIEDRIKRVLIRKILQDFSPEDIKDDTELIELGVGIDSVAALEFIVALEEEFRISIDESQISPELLANVKSISDYISRRLTSK